MSTYSWKSLVRADDKDYNKREVVYRFGNREFLSTDRTTSGVYGDVPDNVLAFGDDPLAFGDDYIGF